MLDLQELTGKVIRIAAEIGAFQQKERESFNREVVEVKKAHDYVSYVDKASEELLVERLKALLPEAGFIAEEGTVSYRDEEYVWVIDPLDGTTNYIHDNAPYCVSIALHTRTELLIGVVYEVCRDECFSAWKGGGAYLNGKRISVSEVSDKDNAFFIVELPYNSEQYRRTSEHLLTNLYGKVGGIRMNGSAAAALCYVAAGRFEGWLEAFLGRWDYAAAALIVMEAGGTVTDFYGKADFKAGHHIVATNGKFQSLLLGLVGESMPDGL